MMVNHGNNNKNDNTFGIFDHRWLIAVGMGRCVKVSSANKQIINLLCHYAIH